jgi:hypothetical protein
VHPHVKTYDTRPDTTVLEPLSQRLGVAGGRGSDQGMVEPSNHEINGITGRRCC